CQSIIFLIQIGIIYWFKDSLEILLMSNSSRKRKMELVAIVFLAIYLIYGSTFNEKYNGWWISIYIVGLIIFWSYVRGLALLETKRELDELKDFELQNIKNLLIHQVHVLLDRKSTRLNSSHVSISY